MKSSHDQHKDNIFTFDLQNIILDYMDDEIGDTAKYSLADNECALFSNRLPILALLQLVAKGEEDPAEDMLRIDASLLYEKDRVKDYSRTFQSISSLQYGGWAYDVDMLKMMVRYITSTASNLALQQFDELETKQTEHGAHFDFSPIVRAIENFDANFKHWDVSKRTDHWCNVYGGEQGFVPACVAQDYCVPGTKTYSPGYPPKFEKPKTERTLLCLDENKETISWFPLSSNKGLGKRYAFTVDRCNLPGVKRCNQLPVALKSPGSSFNGFFGKMDLVFITALSTVRPKQFNRLKQQLRNPANGNLDDSPKQVLDQFFGHFMPRGQPNTNIPNNTDPLLEKANRGDAEAQNALAFRYYQRSIENEKQAFLWWQKSAASNNPVAQFNLALCYDRGFGVARNYKLAVVMFSQAAAQNHEDAQKVLCDIYCDELISGVKSELLYSNSKNQITRYPSLQFTQAVALQVPEIQSWCLLGYLYLPKNIFQIILTYFCYLSINDLRMGKDDKEDNLHIISVKSELENNLRQYTSSNTVKTLWNKCVSLSPTQSDSVKIVELLSDHIANNEKKDEASKVTYAVSKLCLPFFQKLVLDSSNESSISSSVRNGISHVNATF